MAKNFKALQKELDSRPGAAERQSIAETEMFAQLGLYQLRIERQLTQSQLADILDMAQTGVSRIENAEDVRVSTLKSYLAGLGAELRLEAVFADGTTRPIVLSGHTKQLSAAG
jgi:DNA-binding XRE family transcriptional regulator